MNAISWLTSHLQEPASLFAGAQVPDLLVDQVGQVMGSDAVVLVYDYSTEIYAELASWPLLSCGTSVAVTDEHTAQYYYVPYAHESTVFIHFSGNPNSLASAQLESALRVMSYPSLHLTTYRSEGENSICFAGGAARAVLLTGAKTISYAFSEVARKKLPSPRLERVSKSLLATSDELVQYLCDTLGYAEGEPSFTIGAQGPLLSAAKGIRALRRDIAVKSIDDLIANGVGKGAEIWSCDVDNEPVARLRFETDPSVPVRVVHFRFDPLVSAIATIYAAALSEVLPTNEGTA